MVGQLPISKKIVAKLFILFYSSKLFMHKLRKRRQSCDVGYEGQGNP